MIHKTIDLIPYGISPAVFTFETDTITTKGQGGVDVILSHDLKYELLSRIGVEYIYSPDFLNFKNLTAVQFVRLVLRDKFKARYVVCGSDFKFGKGGHCGYKELETLCAEHGIKVIIAEPVILDGHPVSSTRIRQHIAAGEIEQANKLLGYDFQFKLPVVHGNQLGRTINFPTINQYLPIRQIIPRFGVYASKTEIDGKLYKSITNIGIKPTIGGEISPLAETNIFDFSEDLYGKILRVSLRCFIRPETKFASVDELSAQILADTETVKELIEKGKL